MNDDDHDMDATDALMLASALGVMVVVATVLLAVVWPLLQVQRATVWLLTACRRRADEVDLGALALVLSALAIGAGIALAWLTDGAW